MVIALGLVFAAIFAISYRNSQIDESFTKNEEMKKQYISMEKENDQMKVDIENNLNLNNVEQQAKELLGMQRLTNKQTVYISLPKKDYIQPAVESVIIEEDEGIVEKILNKINNSYETLVQRRFLAFSITYIILSVTIFFKIYIIKRVNFIYKKSMGL